MEETNCSSLNLLIAKTLADDDFLVHKETNKENVEKENEVSNLEQTLLCTSAKKQLHANPNSVADRSLPRKGLRVSELSSTLNLTLTERKVPTTKASDERWAKAPFLVHSDNTPKLEKKSSKIAPTSARSNKKSKNQGKSYLEETNNRSVSQKSQGTTKMELLGVQDVPITAVTPENLMSTQLTNLPPINQHKKSKRTPRAVYDNLSLELAYNFEYMEEYISFQASITQHKKSIPHCLTKKITNEERKLIVKSLTEYTISLEYPSFILYQAVKIFDSYINTVEVNASDLKPSALAALSIALKRDLTSDFKLPEQASTVTKLDESAFSGQNGSLLKYEKAILGVLKFEISFGEPSSMLALFTVMIEEVRDLDPSKVHALYYCGCYMIDLSLLHHKLCDIEAITLALISAEISLAIVMQLDETKLTTWSHWRQKLFAANPVLEKYRLSDETMTSIRDQLMRIVILSKDEKSDYHVVYRKYSKARYGQVSDLIVCTYFSACIQSWSMDSHALSLDF